MRKIFRLIYLLTMAAVVLSMSGCGGSSSSLSSSSGNRGKLMVIASPVLEKGQSYKFYRGDKVSAASTTTASYDVSYYVAPLASYESVESVAVNLEFTQSILNDDQPFMITRADDDANVVFFYNPNGNGDVDTSTPYGSVIRSGGATQQLSYTGLTISSSAFRSAVLDNLDLSNQIRITLNADDNTATMNGTAIPSYNYVWHADPDHRDEYYTLGSSTTELTEDYVNNAITENIYIARDIRYMPNTLSFTGTAKNDEETEYAAYYSDSVAAEVAAELGSGFSGPYIFATLPMSTGGMPGGQDGGMTPPDGGFPSGDRTPPNMRSAVSNSDIAAFSTMTHSASEAYNNPVLHIHEAGVYRLSGTWHGQIWIDVDDESDVFVILDGVTVSCDVAPAIVFHDLYECGPTDEDTVASTWRTLGSNLANEAGAVVVIADGSTNNFSGTNVYRMLKAQKKKDSVTTIDGTDVSQQKKRYKMDGAFYSFVSMVIGAESENATGVLNITSDYEGLDTEMHLTIDSGTVNVTADEDGINVNEDYVSVFTMDGGK
ncbi:MAG: carbohydrate-binding domain-containing protein, partial [Synergistaceae bacterium]|nr:carbohydrate-binding domain-containing protein [Synergistaceae bacterium]